MKQIRLNAIKQMEWHDPVFVLRKLRKIEHSPELLNSPATIRNLRTNGLKSEREARDAAIFCHGMSQAFGKKVYFAPVENQDYDFFARWQGNDTQNYSPIQLKEVVPEKLNAEMTVQDVIDKLEKYADSQDVTVAIKLNRRCTFDVSTLSIPKNLSIGGLMFSLAHQMINPNGPYRAIYSAQSPWARSASSIPVRSKS